MRDVSDNAVGKIKTHSLFRNFFRKWCRLWDCVGIYGRARQGTDDITRRRKDTICLPDN